MLCGVEFDADDDGEETVRVSDGVRVREFGRRNEMFLNLSNGEGYNEMSYSKHAESRWLTLGSERKLTE